MRREWKMSKNKFFKSIIIIVFAATFALLGVWFSLGRMETPAPPSAASAVASTSSQDDPGKLFFTSQLMDKSGQMQAMNQWQGKPLIINFWASWCVPCVQEMPELAELQKELSPKGVALIGIGIDSPDNIRQFAAERKIDYPLLIGGLSGTELSRQLGNKTGGLPFTVLIGSDGKVKKTYLGILNFKQFRNDIAQVFN
jgi:thiol-disulfide isomerase/thioredoxin